MGLFSKLFGSSSNIERQLEVEYVPMVQMMMDVPPSEAKSVFMGLLDRAKEDARKEGTSKLPENLGDLFLERESTDEKTKSMLTKSRKEGSTSEDIRRWYNLHDLERRLPILLHDAISLSLFIKLQEEDGLSAKEAGQRVRKTQLIFGDPDDTSHTTGDDRPLPPELIGRINVYRAKRLQEDPEQFMEKIEESSTFNAFIRKEIRRGKI